MSVSAWVVLGVVAVAAVWGVAVYNRFVHLANGVANAFGQIDVQLKRRYDLIPNLVETARKYLQHERETLEAVTAARARAQQAAEAVSGHAGDAARTAAFAAAEGLLGQALGRFSALVESYPELKADQTLQGLSEELASTENRIGFARQAYNDAVMDYNNAVQAFPANIVARLVGFARAAVLEATTSDAERQAPRVQF